MSQPTDTSAALVFVVPCGIAYAIACILLLARIYTRMRFARKLYIDDYIIIIAGVSHLADMSSGGGMETHINP
jgi:nitrate reductase gamma subunit